MIKTSSNKAAGESKPEAYPPGYVEDFDEPRTTLEGVFIIRLPDSVRDNSRHPFLTVFALAHRDRPGDQA
jgi:hypothetical protein